MSKQRLKLEGSLKNRSKVDEKAINRLMSGEVDLATSLGLDDEALKDLRRQAIALSVAGKWQECINVILGVTTLGSYHPVDAVLLSRCYEQLGDSETALHINRHYESLSALGVFEVAEGVAQ